MEKHGLKMRTVWNSGKLSELCRLETEQPCSGSDGSNDVQVSESVDNGCDATEVVVEVALPAKAEVLKVHVAKKCCVTLLCVTRIEIGYPGDS